MHTHTHSHHEQHSSQDLVGEQEVMDICSAVLGTGIAHTARHQRSQVQGVPDTEQHIR